MDLLSAMDMCIDKGDYVEKDLSCRYALFIVSLNFYGDIDVVFISLSLCFNYHWIEFGTLLSVRTFSSQTTCHSLSGLVCVCVCVCATHEVA